jgi:hypothetical protein
MQSHSHRGPSAVRLPAVLAIGFTGHRHLENETKCREAVLELLRAKKDAHEGIVYGVSSAAAGGDQLFAESCMELEIPLRVLLPKPAEQFRCDFDAASWLRTEKILEKALSVEVVADGRERREQYYDCGIQTVTESQLLVALWDGKPSRGMGGTQEIVAFAEKTGHPVEWIDSRTGEVRRINGHAQDHAAQTEGRSELEFLNSLPDYDATPTDGGPHALVAAWMRKMDENANHFAPEARRVASIPVVYTAAASVMSGVAPEIPSAAPWLAVSAVLGVVALGLPWALRMHARQSLWARTRTAAEICRSVLALWNSPVLYGLLGPEVAPELAGVLRSVNFLKMQEARQQARPLAEFKEEYRRDRVADQIAYFTRQAGRAERQGRRYGALSWACGALATAIAGTYFAGKAGWIGLHVFPAHLWIALAMSGLFEVATMAGAFTAMKDSTRRRRRYRELSRALARWDTQIEALNTWGSVLPVAVKVERALLVELLEWRSQLESASHHGK